MAKHASDDWLTTAAKWPGLDDDPLGMRGGRIIREIADLALLVIEQPADTLFRWVPFNLWAVLVWHPNTMASQRAFEGLRWGISVTPFLVRKMDNSLFRST